MAIETLLEFAAERHAAAKAAKLQAEGRLSDTSTKLDQARINAAAAGAELSNLEKETAAIRDALAKISTRADGDALVLELEKKIIALRGQQAKLLALENTLADL